MQNGVCTQSGEFLVTQIPEDVWLTQGTIFCSVWQRGLGHLQHKTTAAHKDCRGHTIESFLAAKDDE